MEEAPSGSSVDGGLEGGAVNVENEMDEIQHYHNTIYIYIYMYWPLCDAYIYIARICYLLFYST